MKKIGSLLIICFSILFFVGCKKDSVNSSSSAYYMKATIGGTAKVFTFNPNVIKFDVGGTSSLAFNAAIGSTSLEGLALQITRSPGTITAGTYTDGGNNDYVVGGTYNPGSNDLSAIYGAGMKISVTAPLKVVITQITASKVTGTFNGEFFDNSGSGSKSLLITNGEFNLPIQ